MLPFVCRKLDVGIQISDTGPTTEYLATLIVIDRVSCLAKGEKYKAAELPSIVLGSARSEEEICGVQ